MNTIANDVINSVESATVTGPNAGTSVDPWVGVAMLVMSGQIGK